MVAVSAPRELAWLSGHSGATTRDWRLFMGCVAAGFMLLTVADVNYQRALSIAPVLIVPERVAALLMQGARLLLIGGAISAYVTGAKDSLPARYATIWGVSLGYSVWLLIKGVGAGGLLTHRVFVEMAPGLVLMSALLFLSATPVYWRDVVGLLRYAAFAAAALICLELVRMGTPSRPEAYARLFTYQSILEPSALVPVAYDAERHGRVRWFSWLPFLALGLAGLVMQTRLVFIVMAFSAGLFVHLANRNPRFRARIVSSRLALFGLAAIFAAGLLSSYSGLLQRSGRELWSRRSEDTRSGQVRWFFRRVPPATLVLGVGIPPEGAYTGQGAEGIDLGYVNMAYFGGIPAVLLFVLLHLVPAARCLRLRMNPLDALCVAGALTYGVRLLSSTVPCIRPSFLLTLFLMGRCAALASARDRRRRTSSWSVAVRQ